MMAWPENNKVLNKTVKASKGKVSNVMMPGSVASLK